MSVYTRLTFDKTAGLRTEQIVDVRYISNVVVNQTNTCSFVPTIGN